jgi:hypothetical protein
MLVCYLLSVIINVIQICLLRFQAFEIRNTFEGFNKDSSDKAAHYHILRLRV